MEERSATKYTSIRSKSADRSHNRSQLDESNINLSIMTGSDSVKTSTPNRSTRSSSRIRSRSANHNSIVDELADDDLFTDLTMNTDNSLQEIGHKAQNKSKMSVHNKSSLGKENVSKKDDSVSFMSLGDSLNEVSWSRIEDEIKKDLDFDLNEPIVPVDATLQLKTNQQQITTPQKKRALEFRMSMVDEDEMLSRRKKLVNTRSSPPASSSMISKKSLDSSFFNSDFDDSDDLSLFSISGNDLFHQQPTQPTTSKICKEEKKVILSEGCANIKSKWEDDSSNESNMLSDLSNEDIDEILSKSTLPVATSINVESEVDLMNTSFIDRTSLEVASFECEPSLLNQISVVTINEKSPTSYFDQMMENVFSSSSESSKLDVAIHFVTQPLTVKHAKIFCSSKRRATVEGFKIDHLNLELVSVYIHRLNSTQVYEITSVHSLTHLNSVMFDKIRQLLPDNEMCTLATGNHWKRLNLVVYDVKLAFHLLHRGLGWQVDYLVHQIAWYDFKVALWLLDTEAPAFKLSKWNHHQCTQTAIKHQLPARYHQYFSRVHFMVNNKLKQSEHVWKVVILFNLLTGYLEVLDLKNLYISYKSIELPSRLCLCLMEHGGAYIDHEYLFQLEKRLEVYREWLEKEIFYITGSSFNLSSPDQVSRAISNQVNTLPNYFDVKKGLNSSATQSPSTSKKSVSDGARTSLFPRSGTSKVEMIKLQEAWGGLECGNKLPTLIMEWRKLNHCLNNSIILIRSKLHFKTDRQNEKQAFIYGRCNEWTSTGRVTMRDPSLINIDKDFTIKTVTRRKASQLERSALLGDHRDVDLSTLSNVFPNEDDDESLQGNKLTNVSFQSRKIVRAPPGYLLISADYSQLELRILAHFSGDPCLLETLNNLSEDVFKAIAATWKRIQVDEVTPDLRQKAKEVKVDFFKFLNQVFCFTDLLRNNLRTR